jgi:hypothetical protein
MFTLPHRRALSGVGQSIALVDAEAPAEPTMTLLPQPSTLIVPVLGTAGEPTALDAGAAAPLATDETGLGLPAAGNFPTRAAMIAPAAVTIAATTAAFFRRDSMRYSLLCAV